MVCAELAARGAEVATIEPRNMPAEAMLQARHDEPTIQEAARLIERAEGVIIATPVYKASYSGLLKLFLDLLPQFAFSGKIALPLAVGGTLSHVLSIDYGLRPVLCSMNAKWVLNSVFVLDRWIEPTGDGSATVGEDIRGRLTTAIDELHAGFGQPLSG
jgi:FMN reductase